MKRPQILQSQEEKLPPYVCVLLLLTFLTLTWGPLIAIGFWMARKIGGQP